MGNASNAVKNQNKKQKTIKKKLLIGMISLVVGISIITGAVSVLFLYQTSQSLAAGATVSDLMGKINVAVIITILVCALFIALSIWISIKIADNIADPMIGLVDRIESLAEGDLHTEVPIVRTKGEIQTLSIAFDTTIRTLNSYISEISNILGHMSKGDFTMKVTQDYKGDFVAIKIALNTIVTSLQTMFVDINQSADQVASGAEQVSCGAQALSQGATEQASTIEQLSASIQEIADHVKQNAANASSANQFAAEAASEVDTGNQHMQQMVAAMEEISESSNEIGAIIKTIQNIAFQTNILALNAAVEAARAGEAGKGFAVVADEVRNLAGKSAEAAKNTTHLIQNSIRAVEKGQKVANETAKSLNAIITGTQQTTELIRQISDSANEEAMAINQVTLGVEQISAVVQTNSATAEESAAASEELSSQAQLMKQNLEHLKLEEEKDIIDKTEEKAQSRLSRLRDRMHKKDSVQVSTPVDEPIAEAVSEPTVEIVNEPIVETINEPITEVVEEPVVETVNEPVIEVVEEPIVEAINEPAVEAAEEPIVEIVNESATEAAEEPTAETAVDTIDESDREPTTV